MRERVNRQGVDLDAAKAEIADLKRRLRELQDDMNRIAPHTGVVLPPRSP